MQNAAEQFHVKSKGLHLPMGHPLQNIHSFSVRLQFQLLLFIILNDCIF